MPDINNLFFQKIIKCLDFRGTFEAAVVRNVTRDVTLTGRPTPPRLLELLKAGGIYPLLEKEGLIAPKA